MTEHLLNQLLNKSIIAALKAGQEISKIYDTGDFNLEMKSDNSPLTKADKTSHKIISQILNNHAINQSINQNRNDFSSEVEKRMGDSMIEQIPILSEEGKDISYDERKNWQRYWLIDPMDGTKEFIKHNGEFTVNIALIENDEPILGVIYAPEYEDKIKDKSKKKEESVIQEKPVSPSSSGKPKSTLVDGEILNHRQNGTPQVKNDSVNLNSVIHQFAKFANFKGALYFSAKSLGAFKAEYIENELKIIKLNAQSSSLNAQSKTAVGSRSHSSDEEKNKLKELGVSDIISVGSSLKFCMVAEGKAQVYYRLGPTMEWDVAAGYSIAKEAGAKIEGLQFNKKNLLNSSFLVTL